MDGYTDGYTDEQRAAALDALAAPATNTAEERSERKAAPRMAKRISKAKAAKLQQKAERLAKNAIEIETEGFEALLCAVAEVARAGLGVHHAATLARVKTRTFKYWVTELCPDEAECVKTHVQSLGHKLGRVYADNFVGGMIERRRAMSPEAAERASASAQSTFKDLRGGGYGELELKRSWYDDEDEMPDDDEAGVRISGFGLPSARFEELKRIAIERGEGGDAGLVSALALAVIARELDTIDAAAASYKIE